MGRPSAGAAGTRTRGFKVHGARSDSYKVNIASIVNISNISNISNIFILSLQLHSLLLKSSTSNLTYTPRYEIKVRIHMI